MLTQSLTFKNHSQIKAKPKIGAPGPGCSKAD